jgi:hypothetical protein
MFSSRVSLSCIGQSIHSFLRLRTVLIFCISSLILPITGEWNNPNPSFPSCVASAISLYAAFPLYAVILSLQSCLLIYVMLRCAAAMVALSISLFLGVFQLYTPSNKLKIDCSVRDTSHCPRPITTSFQLIIVPYIMWAGIILGSYLVSLTTCKSIISDIFRSVR